MKIKIILGNEQFIAELNNTETARKIFGILPVESPFSRWGDEIYFEIPVKCKEENPKEEVEIGDLGYWLAGSCFCIFYGRTPASTSEKPRAVSPVNVFGKIHKDVSKFKGIKANKIRIEKS